MTIQEKKKLTLRVNARLIEQAKAYAARHNTSVSQLVEAFLQNLDDQDESEHTPLVRQLTGLLPADLDAEKAYQDYLDEKYGR